MTLSLEIGYEQLLRLFWQLPQKQRRQFLSDIEKEAVAASEPDNIPSENALQKLLLSGPVWTEEEYQNVLKTREQLNQLGQNAAR